MPKSTITLLNDNSQELLKEFNQALSVRWVIPADLQQTIFSFLENVSIESSILKRRTLLISSINKKLKINKKKIQGLINLLAKEKVFLNLDERKKIQTIFDENKIKEYSSYLKEKKLNEDMYKLFLPASKKETIDYFKSQLHEATINRSDARKGVQSERIESIFRALFCGWLFQISRKEDAYAHNLKIPKNELITDYFKHLEKFHPDTIDRSCGAYSILIDRHQLEKKSMVEIESIAFKEITSAYKLLSNYSNLFIVIEVNNDFYGKVWNLIYSITLFAERFKEESLNSGFFKPEKIKETTLSYIKNIDVDKGDFRKYQNGFFFKDCLVKTAEKLTLENNKSDVKYIVLSFDKKVADENPLPCPSCRSTNVRGNSYPSLGVKSWECQNPICPDRSAFNRGNRFSPLSILRDESSRMAEALIPDNSLSKWKLDVLKFEDKAEIFDMIVRHYSLPGDNLVFKNFFTLPITYIGRSIANDKINDDKILNSSLKENFNECAFFYRYLKVINNEIKSPYREINTNHSWLKIYNGSCMDVLQDIKPETIDSAVTSPPYYNAKDYSTWNNIYCYLHDMKKSAEHVMKALKPGGYYLFNIFDNFDNDNIVALSDLGKRRVILGPYMVDIFKKIGFDLCSNIVWYKGEIEGKRNFNNGKKTPYFQLPLNTWEHIIVLRKPGNEVKEINFPNSVYIRPVIKWVKGENRHGHTAPYPIDIPDLLCSRLPKGSSILDPFAGSMTTALACEKNDQNCIAIELHQSYCDLGLDIIDSWVHPNKGT